MTVKCYLQELVHFKIQIAHIYQQAQVFGVKDNELYDAKYLIQKIIQNLEPLTFISLNGGEMWRHFIDIDDSLTPPVYFEKWCKTYPTTVEYFLRESKNLKTSRPELDNLVKVFIAFENFKLYCGDFNVPKKPMYFVDLFSKKWCELDSINITVLQQNPNNKLQLHCPDVDDYSLIYKPTNQNCLLFLQEGLYEPIIIANSLEGFYKPILYSLFSQDLVRLVKFTLVQTVLQLSLLTLGNCKTDTTLLSVKKVLKKFSKRVKSLVFDETFRGVGVLLDNNLFIHTLAFGLTEKGDYPVIDSPPILNPSELIELLKKELSAKNDQIQLVQVSL